MAELEELKERWEKHNQQLERAVQLNLELLRTTKLKPVETQLRRAAVYAGVEAGMWIAIAAALGSFVVSYMDAAGLLWSGIAADVMCIGMAIALLRRIVMTFRIHYEEAVGRIQKQVEAVRILRIRTTQGGVLVGTLLSLPWTAVALQVAFGIDVYTEMNAGRLYANLLIGVALCPAVFWVSRKYGAACKDQHWCSGS